MSTTMTEDAAAFQNPISLSRESSRGMSAITTLVLGFFLWMNVNPAVAAIRQEVKTTRAKSAAAASTAPDLSAQLNESLQSTLQGLEDILKKPGATAVGAVLSSLTRSKQSEIRDLLEKLKVQDAETLAQFARDEAHFKAHKLAPVIFERHAAALATFKQNSQDVQARLKIISESLLPSQVLEQTQALLKKIEAWAPVRPKFDPNNLPFRTNDPKVRKPAETAQELQKILQRPIAGKSKVNVSELLPPEKRKQAISDTELASILAEEHPYNLDRGSIQTASLGAVMAIPPPGPEFLAPTEDVQITPDIQAKAAELHHNPVEIYNWVRNNVEWIPSYGSIQGSQMTLDKLQGNAFDTASLLIALLRASGIPARYVYGTVDIPVDKLQNWVGGTTNPDAAQNIMGQGGIPNVGLTKGGQTVAIRMEHIWVEGWVDFYPSRGAVNIQGDSWVPMDASYKQYLNTDNYDYSSIAEASPARLSEKIQEGAVLDADNSYIRNANVTAIKSDVENINGALRFKIAPSQIEKSGDLFGSKKIAVSGKNTLYASLPYVVRIRGNTYSGLENNLRQKFSFELYRNERDLALGINSLRFEINTPSLSNRRLTLSFIPASLEDRNALASMLPAPHSDGTPLQPGEYPTQLPAYSIKVVPEFRVDGEAVASGDPIELGTNLISSAGFLSSDLLNTDHTTSSITAGLITSIGTSLGGVSTSFVEKLGLELNSVNETIIENSEEKISRLSKEHFLGVPMNAAIATYFMSLETYAKASQKTQRILDYPGISFGLLHVYSKPRRSYGITSSIEFPGYLMDVGHIRYNSFSIDGTTAPWTAYNVSRGVQSSVLEHETVNIFFANNGENSAKANSAISALSYALKNGQKMYSISKDNISKVNEINQSAAVMQNINAALNAGKNVIIHENPISSNNFTGAGYIILDPDTGAGQFLIEGGANGSLMSNAAVLTSAAASAYADGATGDGSRPNELNGLRVSDRQIYLRSLANISSAVAKLGLAISLYVTAVDSSRTLDQKIGSASTALLTFAIVTQLTAALAASIVPVSGVIILSILIAMTMALSELLINAYYFSLNDVLRKRRWA